MRILQAAVPNSFVTNSPDPGLSLRSAAFSMATDILIDDSGLGTKYAEFEISEVSNTDGMVFMAKDMDTLSRGFREIGRKKGNASGFRIKGKGECDLGLLGVEWAGDLRSTNKFTVGVTTLGHNLRAAVNRGAYHMGIGSPSGKVERYVYESMSKNLDKVDRDGRFGYNGAAILVCPAAVVPLNAKGTKSFRQIGGTLDCGTLASLVRQVL